MFSALFRFAFSLQLILGIALPAAAQEIPPYQFDSQRQVCGAAPILDAPGGNIIGAAVPGSIVKIDRFGFSPDGTKYYHLTGTAPEGYIATESAPHFCGFAERTQSGAAHFRAIPNNCHLIAASRRTLDEVNSFAAEYAAFLPTMSVYRADNGWYAIALGQISVAAAPSVLANSRIIPGDSYCSDGAGYAAIMDLKDGKFRDPEAAASDGRLRQACATGDRSACRSLANIIAANPKRTETDEAEVARLLLPGCMAGNADDCEKATIVPTEIRDHAMITAWPGSSEYKTVQLADLYRIGCDAGRAVSCRNIVAYVLDQRLTHPGRYTNGIHAGIVGCAAQNRIACKMLYRLFDRWTKVMGEPPGPNELFYMADLRAETCKSSADFKDSSCEPVSRIYAALLERDDATPDQQGTATSYLRARCDIGDVDTCKLFSGLAGNIGETDRRWAAARAIAACEAAEDNEACERLDDLLDTELPESAQLIQDKFRRYSDDCRAGNTIEAEEACSTALLYYAEKISATEIAPLEAVLHEACTPELYSGCDTLAFVYSTYGISGSVTFKATNQPEKRLAVLRTGCRPGKLGLNNCSDLGEVLAEWGEHQEAQASYRIACNTIRQDNGSDPVISADGSCFEAGLHALRKLDDRDSARADFDFVCRSSGDLNRPYACKHLALMKIEDGGKADDFSGVLHLLEQACYPRGNLRGDGEGCLYYGQILLEFRNRLHWGPEPDVDDTEPVDDTDLIRTASTASYIFSEGCLSHWQAACEARETLVANWIAGAYPHDRTTCQIRDAEGRITSDKTCSMVSYAVPVDGPADDDSILGEHLYIWPDGDRTLVTDGDGSPTLNGSPAGFYTSAEDGMLCQQNSETGNSFCTLPRSEEAY